MSLFGDLKEKFARRGDDNFAIAGLNGVYLNPPQSQEWQSAIGECVASFGKNKLGLFVIRILDKEEKRSLYRFSLYKGFVYEEQSEKWHSWEHAGVFYGLDFKDAKEAREFASAVKAKVDEAPPPEPSRPKKLDSASKQKLKETAAKHGLPDTEEAVAAYEQAGLTEQELEDEPTRILVQDELDNLMAALSAIDDESSSAAAEIVEEEMTTEARESVKPRPRGDDSSEQMQAELERLREALEERSVELKRARRQLARERNRKFQFRRELEKHKIPIPKPRGRPRKMVPRVKQTRKKTYEHAPSRPVPLAPADEPAPTSHASSSVGITANALQNVKLAPSDPAPTRSNESGSGITANALQNVKLTRRKHPDRWNVPKEPKVVDRFGKQLSDRLWVRRMARRFEASGETASPTPDPYQDDDDSWSTE